MKKLISLCIIAAMLTGLFSSCANPPGSKPSSDTLPQPGDQPETEKVVAEPDPVDLSGLTEEELGKIDEFLLDNLKIAASNVPLKLNIRLKRPLDTNEFDTAVDAQIKYNTERRNEITAEITALKEQKAILSQNGIETETKTNSTLLTEIDSKITELQTEYKSCSLIYNDCVNQVIAANHRPILDSFMKKYGLESEGDRYLAAAMTVEHINITPLEILDIIKDSNLEYIFYPEGSIVNYYEGDLALSNNSTNTDTIPISDTEVNEIYNLIDGEIAVNNNKKEVV